MSRIGLAPIVVPSEVKVDINKGGSFGNLEIKVSGPKGSLSQSIRHGIDVAFEANIIKLSRTSDLKQFKSMHGLYRALINNMIIGVVSGFVKNLEIIGIGYRAEATAKGAIFSLGYSHKINYETPEGVVLTIADQTKVKVEGMDKQLVGEVAAKIRGFKKPEPYKGKGIKYSNEVVRRKSGKAGVK